MKKYIVLKPFADKNNISKHYKPGDELPGEFGEDRLTNIVKLGLAKVEDTEAGKGNGSGAENPVTDIDIKSNVATIISQVKGFVDVEKLNAYLAAEKASEKPRATVINAIEDRLANIAQVEDTEAGKGNGSGAENPVTDIDIKSNVATIISQVKGFVDVEKLNAYLAAEKASEKPRATVINAIEDRLANIVKK